MAQRIQLRRDTAANWTSVNPTLGQGEYGYETDTKKHKIGDGTTTWASLAYASGLIASNNLSDVANAATALANIGGQPIATVVSSNTTAAIDGVYHVTASATFTDPSPTEGKGYTVFVRNGTATIGGTPYATAGTIIKRVYHSGAWASYFLQVDGTYEYKIDTAIALTDAATIDITDAHHTLTTASSRTFTKSYTGDSVKMAITLNATSATFTLPAGDKGIYNGTPSGTNTLVVTGATSGDIIVVAIEKVGSVNIWVGRNSIR